MKVGELFASFNLDTSGLDGAVKGAESKLSGIGSGLSVAGVAAMAAVGAAAKKAATEIYEAGTEFDSQMSKVFAIRTFDKSVAEDVAAMDALSAKALEMGSTTQFTASQAGQAFEYMAMAGWDTAAMLGGIEPILNLAAAAGEDLGTTSDIVTDAMTAFGYTIDSVGGDTAAFMEMTTHFTDVLAAASSHANTNVSMMGESFKYAGAIAGSMGYSIEDTAVALGLLANSGIKASQAGTSLRTMMTKLNGDIKIGGKNMQEVTIKTSNADGSMRDFMDIIKDCRKAFEGLTESEKASMAQSIVGRNAMSGFLALMNASESDVENLTSAITNCAGSTEKMADMMLDNAAGDVTLFQSAVEGLEITLWHLVEGSFREVIQGATEIVDSFRRADPEIQLGTLRMGELTLAASAVGPALSLAMEALPGLAAALMTATTPAGLFTLGLIALGAAAVDADNTIGKTLVAGLEAADSKLNTFAQDFEKQRPALETEMSAFLSSCQTAFSDSLPGIVESVISILSTGITAIADEAPDVAATALALVNGVARGISNGAATIIAAGLQLVSSLTAEFIKSIPDLLQSGADIAGKIIEGITGADWAGAGATIRGAITSSLAELKENLFATVFGEDSEENAGDWEALGKRLIQNISKGIFGAADEEGVYGTPEAWKTLGTNLIDKAFEGITAAIEGSSSFVSGVIDGIAALFSDENIAARADMLSGIAGKLIEKTAELIPTLTDKAGTILQKIAELIFGDGESSGIAASALEGANTLAQAIMEAVVAGIPTAVEGMKGLVTKIGEILNGIDWTKEAGALSGIGEAIITVITEGIKGASGLAVTIVETIGSMFGEEGIATKLVTAAGSIASSLIENIVEAIPDVAGAAVNIIGAIGKVLEGNQTEGFLTAISGVASSIINGIIGAIPDVADAAANIIGAIGNLFTAEGAMDSIAAGALGIASSLLTGITDAIPALSGGAAEIVTSIGQLFNENGIVEKLATAATSIAGGLLTAVVDAIPKVKDGAVSIVRSLGQLFNGENAETLATAAGRIATELLTAIKDAIPNVLNGAVDIIGAIGSLFTKDNNEDVTAAMTGLMEDVFTQLPGIIEGFGTHAGNLISAIGTALFGNGDGSGIVTFGIDALTGIVTTVFENLPAIISGMSAEAANLISSIGTALFGSGEENGPVSFGVEKLTELVEAVFAQIPGMISGLGESAGNIVQAIGTALFGTDEGDGMVSFGLKALADIVQSVFEQIPAIVAGLSSEAGKILEAIGTALFGAGENGGLVEAAAGSVQNLAKSIAESIATAMQQISADGSIGSFADILTSLINGMISSLPTLFTTGETVVSAGMKIATELLHSITEGFSGGGLDADIGQIASAWISSLAGILGGALDFGGELIDAGTKIAGSLLDSLLGAFDTEISTEGVSAVGEKLKNVAQKIITGITTLLPKLFTVGGEAISAGVKLATELVTSLADGFTSGNGLDIDFASIAQGLVTGIVNAVSNLPALLSGVLSAGAQIANSIMGSIASSLTDLKASGVSESFGTAAADLVKSLLKSIGNLSENADVQGFVRNLGTAISQSANMLGDVLGSFLREILSEDGLKSIYNAGRSIVTMLWEGLKSGLTGLGDFVNGIVAGWFGYEAKTETERAAEYAASMIKDFSEIMMAAFGGNINTGNLSDRLGENAATIVGKAINSAVSKIDPSVYMHGAQATGQALKTAVDEAISSLPANTLSPEITRYISGLTESFWIEIANSALENGSFVGLDFRSLIVSALIGSAGSEGADEAVKAVYESLFGSSTAAEQAASEVAGQAGAALNAEMTEAFADASGKGTQAAAAAIDENTSEVEAAALAAGDVAVKAFMLTLSAENGTQIGESFVGALIAALNGKIGVAGSTAQSIGAAALNGVQGAAPYSSAFNVGVNFGQGFANGISSMQDTVSDAASSLGSASLDALSGIIREGSPSKETMQSGINYALGYAEGMEGIGGTITRTAEKLGNDSVDALNKSVNSSFWDFFTGLFTGKQTETDKPALPAWKTAGADIVDAVSGACASVEKETAKAGDTLTRVTERTLSEMNKKGNLSGPAESSLDSRVVNYIGNSAGKILSETVSRVAQTVSQEAAYVRQRQYIAPNGEIVSASNDIEPVIKRFAGLVTDALANVGVYMDGEPVGHIVANTVSEDIARNSAIRRYATV